MLQYVFFHQQPYQLFIDFARVKGLSPVTSSDGDSLEISLPDELSDNLQDAIDDEYDRLFEMNQLLVEQTDMTEQEYSMAAVDVTLQDGSISPAFVKPDLINKIMSVMTAQQFAEVVHSIVQAVENPDSRPFCERVRNDGL